MRASAAGTLLFCCPHCEQPIQSPSFSLGSRGLCPWCGGNVAAADDAEALGVIFFDMSALDAPIEPSDFVMLLSLMSIGWDGAPVAVTKDVIALLLERQAKLTPRRIKKGIRRLERAGLIRSERDNAASPVKVQICKPVPRMKVS